MFLFLLISPLVTQCVRDVHEDNHLIHPYGLVVLWLFLDESKVEKLQLLVRGDEAFGAAGRVKDSVIRHSRKTQVFKSQGMHVNTELRESPPEGFQL